MKYSELTINQKISLKWFIENDPKLELIKLVQVVWGWVKAIEYFLNEDINELTIDPIP